ncbi:hypothetical protein AALP_AA6G199600 [Arabis alpina]|uniref:Uncharacterized protein n=1 Tax=Arabis alpina TaxID=50452 RepID=A0A087GQF5_ARAAL|nr:hypothetical protein AALP_AA6G199600 [Arabis alpina]
MTVIRCYCQQSEFIKVQQASSVANGSYGPAKDGDKYSRGSEGGHKSESGSSYGPAKDGDKYSRGSEGGHKSESGSMFSEGGRNGSAYSNGTANGVWNSAYGPTPARGPGGS